MSAAAHCAEDGDGLPVGGVLVAGLAFPEEPRWRGGLIWFVDAGANLILAVDEAGAEARRIALDFSPGGLGWLPDGTLLAADPAGRRLVAFAPGRDAPRTYADVSAHIALRPNGLAVSRAGVAYVAGIGAELTTPEPRPSGNVVAIAPEDLRPTVLLDRDLRFPNGISLSADEARLFIPETFGERVTLLDLASGAVAHAATPGVWPDGSCAAPDGGLWVADAGSPNALRLDAAGRLVQTVSFPARCFAPALNGAGDRLYAAIAEDFGPEAQALRTGAIAWLAV